ncbi:MAG: hypothetical protein ACTHMS_20215 [Jatrophihabitans sp.]|uniref:hypothetical protein n=1 Tax=Jatrophihabitans sp. TaxID=1932789 RepID=UPI003F806850
MAQSDPSYLPPSTADLARDLASMPDDTVLTHRTSGQRHGLWLPAFERVEVSTPANVRGSRYTTSVQRRDVIAHRLQIDPSQIVVVAGLPMTTIEQTWVHLAAVLDIYDLIAAGDSALRLGASLDTMTELVRRAGRRPGVPRAREALKHLDARSKSRPESRIRAAIVLAGLPKPDVNKTVYDHNGDWLGEADLSYEEATTALEYNGAVHDAQRVKDSVKLLGFNRAKWAVRIYTAPHAFVRMHEVVSDVRQLLSERAPHLLAQHYRVQDRVTNGQDRRRRISRHRAS